MVESECRSDLNQGAPATEAQIPASALLSISTDERRVSSRPDARDRGSRPFDRDQTTGEASRRSPRSRPVCLFAPVRLADRPLSRELDPAGSPRVRFGVEYTPASRPGDQFVSNVHRVSCSDGRTGRRGLGFDPVDPAPCGVPIRSSGNCVNYPGRSGIAWMLTADTSREADSIHAPVRGRPAPAPCHMIALGINFFAVS